jgi:RES domain-containing protein
MHAYRIAERPWALDATGAGAAMFGGRWNEINVPALYAGLSVEICALEKLVHLAGRSPRNLVLVRLSLPDAPTLYLEPVLTALPEDWQTLPAGPQAARFGSDWLESGRQLGLIVPSVVLPEARNIVLNPRHPAMREVRLDILREFSFDVRLLT